MRTFGERSQIARDLSLSLVEKSRHRERTTTNTNLQKTKNNDFKTTSKRTSAYTSECQISPEFSRTLGQFVIVWRGLKSSLTPVQARTDRALVFPYLAYTHRFSSKLFTRYHEINAHLRALIPDHPAPHPGQIALTGQIWFSFSK